MAKTIQLKPEEQYARAYVDRLILGELTDLNEVVKLSEIAERLQKQGIGLAAVRSLLASNPNSFLYDERRWVPAARLTSHGCPMLETMRQTVDRFGGPMPFTLLVRELMNHRVEDEEEVENSARRMIESSARLFFTNNSEVALSDWCFVATDESHARAFALNNISAEDVDALVAKMGADFNWRDEKAITKAVKELAPISVKVLGAAAWVSVNPQNPKATLVFDWKHFYRTLFSLKGYIYGADGILHPEDDAKKWITLALKVAEKIAPTVEIEDAAPIDLRSEDLDKIAARIEKSEISVTATQILEDSYEITPSVKTFPHDLANVIAALKSRDDVWWVGADRFRKPGTAPDFINELPEPFKFVVPNFKDDEGERIDVELSDEGLSSTLRKLLSHPLSTDVLDEDIMPAPKGMAEQLRLVLKPIHRELGTFPLCQFPTGWIEPVPEIQELIFIDPQGNQLEVWANMRLRLLFNLIDWFFEQPVESGAVFSLTRTAKPNVFEFAWLDQTDPVVFITGPRMEELRELQARSDEMSSYEVLREIMSHWPKGADFLTVLWEMNVVRRTSRRLLASLLSGYQCFYQRSGSPVWHYDHKKVDLGFDKAKVKFILK